MKLPSKQQVTSFLIGAIELTTMLLSISFFFILGLISLGGCVLMGAIARTLHWLETKAKKPQQAVKAVNPLDRHHVITPL